MSITNPYLDHSIADLITRTKGLDAIYDKIVASVLTAPDVWGYASRTLTPHAFPFTNPAAMVALSNLRVSLLGGVESYLDIEVSSRSSGVALLAHDLDIKTLISALNDISALDVWTYGTRTLTSPTFGNLVTKNLANIVADEVAFNGADIATILTRVPTEVTQRAKSVYKITEVLFSSSTRITVTGTAGNLAIKNNFAISLIPSGVTIDYVHIYVFCQVIENTNASPNKVNGAQYTQIRKTVGGTWTNCVSILDDALQVPASTRDMGRLLGAPIDCKSEVTGNGNYDLQWTNARMDLDSMYLDDTFFIVEVGFH